MPFYHVKSPGYELKGYIEQICFDRNIYSLEDGSLLVHTSLQLERAARLREGFHEFADIFAGSKCGLGDARHIVRESQDSELELWFQRIANRIREKSKRNLLGQGR